MPEWLNKANILILAWSVYNSQGIFFPEGTLFTQLLILVLLFVSCYHCFVANTKYKLPIYFGGLNVLLIMFVIYGLYLIVIGDEVNKYAIHVVNSNYLKDILISFMPIYSFYVLSREKLICEKNLCFWVIVFLVLAIGSYYKNEREMLLMTTYAHSSAVEFTNNAGYLFVTLIAMSVFFEKKKIVQYALLLTCICFIVMSMKRGAILIGIVALVYFIWNSLKSSSFKGKLGVILASGVLCFISLNFVQEKMEKSAYFQKRVEETYNGNSSGRNKIYGTLVNYYWYETNAFQFIFGSGANSTLKIAGNYAHNDWLEIAVNQGFIGLMIFFLYWFVFAKNVFFQKNSHYSKLCLQLLFFVFLLKTFFSMSYSDMPISASCALGYCFAQGVYNE